MANEQIPVAVEIRQRTLFIGWDAYPLQGIVSFSPVTLVVNKARAWGRFFAWVFFPVIVGVVSIQFEQGLAGIVALLWITILIIILVRRLSLPPLHLLRIENAAGSVHYVHSENNQVVRDVIGHLVAAIDQPTITYGPIHLTTVKAGRDYVNVGGSVGNLTTGGGK